ncbi:MAG: efflux RND transporter permease subunit [Gammaproteobacteria bacterium]|nr:efflux RND transporter permease subunit [Gammaproteobacteria bacterium]
MNNLFIDAVFQRARTTLLLMCMVVIAGVVARCSIPIESSPNIEVPVFVIGVPHPGISPEDAERLLVKPLEIELQVLDGIEEVRGTANEGLATVVAEFDADFDLDQALLDVRDAVSRAKPEFPNTAEEPYIQEVSANDFPILQVNVIGPEVQERVIYNIARELQDQIETLPDVLEVRMFGDREELLEVMINPEALEAYGVATEELLGTVARNNQLIPAGSLDTGAGRMAVKVPSVIENAQDLFDLPLKTNGDAVVTLSDVATVRQTFKDRERYSRVNGNTSITLDIVKRQNANLVDTVEKAKALVERARPDLPNRVTVFYSNDQAPYARTQVNELQGNILTALVLVMVLVVAAMGFRAGLIVGAAIPVSFLFALAIVWVMGYSFNFMVMFGMLLGLGMLIDGAIVITEYADRKMVEGHHRRMAYSMAAKRMFWPVTASVATTLAAFLPLLFWPGVSGKFMRYLPVTVFAVLSGSLLYALMFGPTLGAVFDRPRVRDERAVKTLRELEDGDPRLLPGPTGWYAHLLHFTSKHALATLSVGLLLLATIFTVYLNFGRGMVFFTNSDPMYAQIHVRARGNLSAEEGFRLVQEVEQRVVDVPGIKDVNLWTSTGSSFGGGFNGGSNAPDIIGSLNFELHPPDERDMSGREILELLRQRTADLAGILVEVREQEEGPPVGKPVQIQFSSNNAELLDPVVRRVREHLDTKVDGLRDIEDTRAVPGVEWRLAVDRAQAALYGADVTLVGVGVQLVTAGVKVGEYRPDTADDAVDIRVRFPSDSRGLAALDDLTINTTRGRVPISNFVTRTPAAYVDNIERIDGRVVEFVRANVAPGVLADDKVKEIQAWLDGAGLDSRVDIAFRGANEEQQQSMEFVSFAFLMSLLLMFVLLVTQFNSLYQSAVILAAVVMSTAGVLLGLLVTNTPFSAVMTGIGVVALAGIVVNNNIVLIDTYNVLKRNHPELDDLSLIVRTGAQRLRPVLLTTVTTVFGLLPLAANFSVDLVSRDIVYGSATSSFWVPLSQAIVSGLSFATLLTLVATPAMLALPAKLRARTAWLRKRRTRPLEPAVPVEAPVSAEPAGTS